MEVRIKVNKQEIEEIVSYYFEKNKDAHEPVVTYLKNGEFEVVYEDFSIQDGTM